MSIAAKIIGILGGVYNLFQRTTDANGGIVVRQKGGAVGKDVHIFHDGSHAILDAKTGALKNLSGGAADWALLTGGNYPIQLYATSIIGWSSSPGVTTPSAGLTRVVDEVVRPTGATTGGWFQSTGGRQRTSSQVDATTTTLANILTATLLSGRKYKFWAYLPVTADVVGGYKVAMAGTCTATAIYYDVTVVASGVAPSLSRQTALAGAASGTLGTTVGIYIEGLITVNAAGTLVVQFAQSAANGTSSVLVGADMMTEDYP